MQKTSQLHCKTDQQRANSYALVAMVLLILLASLFRLYNLGERSLWYDEAASVGNVRSIIKLPPYEDWSLVDFFRRERLPPLYFFYMLPFYYISQSEWAIRFSSAIWGIAAVPLAYCFGAKLISKKIGLVGALLLVFSPLHIYYSQELRPYSLFMFLSIVLFYAAVLALEENRDIHFIGMTMAGVLGLYTHTYMLFPLFIANAYFISQWKAYHHPMRKWLLSNLAIAVLCIPACLLVVYHITKGATGLADFSPGLRALAGTFYLFTFGRFFFPTQSNLILIAIQGVVFGSGLFLGVLTVWRGKSSPRGHKHFAFFAIAAITYTGIWLVSLGIMPLLDEARANYLIFFLPLYYILVVTGWDYLPNIGLRITLISLAILISLISIYPFYFEWDRVGKGQFRIAAEYIRGHLEENDVVFHSNAATTLPLKHYLGWRVPQLRIATISDQGHISNDRIWLVAFLQKGGFDFGLQTLMGRPISTQGQRDDISSKCNVYMKNDEFRLVDHQAFSGKNELIVCLYRRETPDSLNLKERAP